MKGRGMVRIDQGPLHFYVDLDEPLTGEQMRALAGVSTAMHDIRPLFDPQQIDGKVQDG